MSEMTKYRIDLTMIRSREELHEELMQTLALPAYYGGTLDALYDALSEIRGQIIVTGFEEAEKNLADYARGFRTVCEDAAAGRDDLRIIFEERPETGDSPDLLTSSDDDTPEAFDASDDENIYS